MSVKPKALIPVVIMAVAMVCGCVDYGRVAVDSEDPFHGSTLDSKDLLSTAEKMARGIVRIPQIATADKPPTVAFARVTNRSSQPLDTDLYLEEIRTRLIKHTGGKLIFLDRARSEEVLRERELKRTGEVTASSKKAVLGADYFLTGSIRSVDKGSGRVRSTATFCRFRLTDAETMQIMWEDSYQVKKIGKQGVWDR